MKKAGIFLADGFEEVEGLTVVDLLRRAGMEVETLSIMEKDLVESSHKVTVKADKLAKEADYDSFDILVLPGGMPGTLNLGNSGIVQESLEKQNQKGKWIGAICAAPSVLGEAGLLRGKEAVCYPGFEEKLLEAKVCVEPVKVDGNIITSRGMGTAIDFGLAIIEQLISKEKAEEIGKGIIYRA